MITEPMFSLKYFLLSSSNSSRLNSIILDNGLFVENDLTILFAFFICIVALDTLSNLALRSSCDNCCFVLYTLALGNASYISLLISLGIDCLVYTLAFGNASYNASRSSCDNCFGVLKMLVFGNASYIALRSSCDNCFGVLNNPG